MVGLTFLNLARCCVKKITLGGEGHPKAVEIPLGGNCCRFIENDTCVCVLLLKLDIILCVASGIY